MSSRPGDFRCVSLVHGQHDGRRSSSRKHWTWMCTFLKSSRFGPQCPAKSSRGAVGCAKVSEAAVPVPTRPSTSNSQGEQWQPGFPTRLIYFPVAVAVGSRPSTTKPLRPAQSSGNSRRLCLAQASLREEFPEEVGLVSVLLRGGAGKD